MDATVLVDERVGGLLVSQQFPVVSPDIKLQVPFRPKATESG